MTKPAEIAEIPLEILRDDAGLRVMRRAGQSDRMVVCFSSVGAGPDVPPPPEWQRLAGRNPSDHLLFLADPARSWLNRPELIEEMGDTITAESTRLQVRRTAAIGFSLGGFSTLVMPAFAKIDVALALSPQISVDPSVVPEEKRWKLYRDKIAYYRIRSAEDHIQPHCQYFIFLGAHPRERLQRQQVGHHPNLDYYVMANSNHNTQVRLKEAGVLDAVIDACFDGARDRVQQIMAEKFGSARLTPGHF